MEKWGKIVTIVSSLCLLPRIVCNRHFTRGSRDSRVTLITRALTIPWTTCLFPFERSCQFIPCITAIKIMWSGPLVGDCRGTNQGNLANEGLFVHIATKCSEWMYAVPKVVIVKISGKEFSVNGKNAFETFLPPWRLSNDHLICPLL